jgi:hypothetical protein
MVVLPVLVPFTALIVGFVRPPFPAWFSNPQPTQGRVTLTFPFRKPADPTRTGIILAVTPERMMNLIYQVQGEVEMDFISGLRKEFEIIAHRKCISPQVTLRVRPCGGKTGQPGKGYHDLCNPLFGFCRIHHFTRWRAIEDKNIGSDTKTGVSKFVSKSVF